MKNPEEVFMSSCNIRLSPQVTWRKVDRRIVVLNTQSQRHYLLNELGGRIWKAITSGKSLQQAIRSIAREYAVSQERAERDVSAFLAGLEAEKIISLETSE